MMVLPLLELEFLVIISKTISIPHDDYQGQATPSNRPECSTSVRHEILEMVNGNRTRVSGANVIIGDQGQTTHFTRCDCSTKVRHDEIRMVDQVSESASGHRLVKVRVRSVRNPHIGNKFSRRHGQKGVVGMTFTQKDMPWTLEGTTPDVIVNSYSIPSRMTVGQLMECIMGKVAAREAKECNG